MSEEQVLGGSEDAPEKSGRGCLKKILIALLFIIVAPVIFYQVPRGRVAIYQFALSTSKDTNLSTFVLRKLEAMGPVALPGFVTALNADDWEVRSFAADSIGQLGPEGAPAVPELLKYLDDEKAEVRGKVVYALGKIGTDEAIKGVGKALADKEKFVRQYGVEVLSEQGERAQLALTPLIGALGDSAWEVRELACKTLGEIGAPAKGALPKLAEIAAKDSDEDVRVVAKEAMVAISGGGAKKSN